MRLYQIFHFLFVGGNSLHYIALDCIIAAFFIILLVFIHFEDGVIFYLITLFSIADFNLQIINFQLYFG
jgi:hypothetical protein